MRKSVDVLVVGGGPSGVITAYSVAKAGYSCVILDKKTREQIGDKNCGDALDGMHAAIIEKEMGIAPPSLENGEARDLIKKMTIAVKSLNNKFTADAPGFLVNRLIYGQRLLSLAEEEGVIVYSKCSVRDVLVEDDQIAGVKYIDENRKKQEIRAKITVDASGYTGIIRKNIPSELKNGIDYSFPDHYSINSYREIIKFNNKEDHQFREEIVLIYHERIPPPGYIWIFSEGKNMLNIGIAWQKNLPYAPGKSMKKLFHECLDPYFNPSEYEVIHSGGGNIPMRPQFDSLVFNGALLVGDAGGLTDATTFEGHGPALESGRLAGKAIIKALKSNSFKYQDLWTYNESIMEYPGGMHVQSFLTSKLFSEIGTDNLFFLFDKNIISEEELIILFQDRDTNISVRSKIIKFLRAFPRWGLMFKIKKYADLIEKAPEIYQKYPNDPSKLMEWRNERNKELKLNF